MTDERKNKAGDGAKKPDDSPSDPRAAALRQNLQRRKEQARGRAIPEEKPEDS